MIYSQLSIKVLLLNYLKLLLINVIKGLYFVLIRINIVVSLIKLILTLIKEQNETDSQQL